MVEAPTAVRVQSWLALDPESPGPGKGCLFSSAFIRERGDQFLDPELLQKRSRLQPVASERFQADGGGARCDHHWMAFPRCRRTRQGERSEQRTSGILFMDFDLVLGGTTPHADRQGFDTAGKIETTKKGGIVFLDLGEREFRLVFFPGQKRLAAKLAGACGRYFLGDAK